jgi:hypothetical protein
MLATVILAVIIFGFCGYLLYQKFGKKGLKCQDCASRDGCSVSCH